MDSRLFASQRNLHLTFITGTYGTSSLPDINSKLTDLSLYIGRNSPNLLTVPETFWKVLYEPISQYGVVFVGHNNPYEKNVASMTICRNICNKINWLNWDAVNITAGYSYCCEVNDFRRTATYLPEFEVKGLLTWICTAIVRKIFFRCV